MKQINYTGSSKIISRIVNLLNRKAPLPLDGDGDPDWGTNGQVLSTDGSGGTAWVNQGGGGSTYTAGDGIDISAQNEISVDTTFTEASTRVNIASGDTFSTILGKIKKWFSDLSSMFVSKSGDTMTGRLTIASTDANDWQPLVVKSNFANACFARLYDKNGTELGAFGCNEANVPYFRDGNGVLHVLSQRKVTTLVNETANIAASGNKTYATLTASALSAYDEIWIYAEYGNVANNGSASKAQIAAAASYGGGAGATIYFMGYVLETSGTISITYAFGIKPLSTGLTVYNRSVSSTIGKLLIEGVTY